MNKILLSITLVGTLLLSGCSMFKGPEVPPQEVIIIKPDPIPEFKAKSVEYQIWNQQKLLDEGAKTANKDKIFYVLTPENATNLFDNLINLSDTLGKSIRTNKYYQDGIDVYNKRIKEAEEKK